MATFSRENKEKALALASYLSLLSKRSRVNTCLYGIAGFPACGDERLERMFCWHKWIHKPLLELMGSSTNRTLSLTYYFTLEPPKEKKFIIDFGDDPFYSQLFCHLFEETKVEGCEDGSYSLSEEKEEVRHFIGDKCPIYRRLKERDGKDEKEDNKEDVWHIQNYFHARREKKTLCKNARNCERVQRLHGRGYSTEDMRHSLLFRHKMIRQSSMLAKMGDIFRMSPMEYCKANAPQVYAADYSKNFLVTLCKEVIRNGYIEDLLCGLGCPKVDIHNLSESDCKLFPIWQVVEGKLIHPIHEEMGFPLKSQPSKMLAIILYTGGKCNEDLCKSQREGDLKKWEHFDFCLLLAINQLSYYQMFDFPLYCGLNGVYFEETHISAGYFNSYLSTSKCEDVAISFRGKRGALIKIEAGVKSGFAAEINCCDVSWISKFPNEMEILISRGDHFAWKAKVIDETSEGQFVSLSLSSKSLEARAHSAFCHLPFDYNSELVPNDKLLRVFNDYIKARSLKVESVEDIYAHMKEDSRLSKRAFVEEAIENIKGRVKRSQKLVREAGEIDLQKFDVYECRKGLFRRLKGQFLRISTFGKWVEREKVTRLWEKEIVFIHRKKERKPVPPGW